METNTPSVQAIIDKPSFQRLLRLRNTVRFSLAAAVLGLHGFFVGGIGFYTEWFGTPYTAGSSIPNGIIYTAIIILLMLALEMLYIVITHKYFDPMQKQLAAEVASDA